MRDAVVIGASLVGLTAALRLAHGGVKITLVTKGIEGLQFSQGIVDSLGYSGLSRTTQSLIEVETRIALRPGHPCSHFTPESVAESVNWPEEVLDPKLLVGDPRQNVIIPTSLGALRPMSLYQPSMAADILAAGKSCVIVGLRRLRDFYPKIIAKNLSCQATADGASIQVRSPIVDVEVQKDEANTTGANHTHALDDAATCERSAVAIAPYPREGEIASLPTILDLNDLDAWKDTEEHLGHEVFEVVMQPPSIPGIRLNQELTTLMKAQARFIIGSYVTGVETEDGVITAAGISTAGRPTRIEAKNVVFTGGGFEPGVLDMDPYETVIDPVLGLSVLDAEDRLLHRGFWSCEQPVLLADLGVDDAMYLLNANKKSVYSNIYAVSGNLAGVTRWREKSGEGIALASILCAAD